MAPQAQVPGAVAALARKDSRKETATPNVELKGDKHECKYCPYRAADTAGYATIDDMILGVRLSILAYADDNPQYTINKYKGDMVLNGTYLAIEQVAGGPQQAMMPLSQILRMQGWTPDVVFSHTECVDFQQVDTQGFIAHKGNDIALVYRGTTGGMDWLTNVGIMRTIFEPLEDEEQGSGGFFDGCRSWFAGKPSAHEGFYNGFLQSMEDIEEYIMPLLEDEDTPKRLIIAGHSLGGALATAALGCMIKKYDFLDSPHEILYVTIGQPRFGDSTYTKWLQEQMDELKDADKLNIARIVNDYDSVPTVPPSQFGFNHIDGLCVLTDEGDLLIDPDCSEVSKECHLDDPRELIEDHRPDHYLNLLLQYKDSLQTMS